MWFNNYAEVLICKIQKNTVESGDEPVPLCFYFTFRNEKMLWKKEFYFRQKFPQHIVREI